MSSIDKVEIHKEIDLIQDCIKRMAQNSFMIKGWFIGLYVVALGLLPKEINIKLLCVILGITTILFWYLDAYFLKQEKRYRNIYKWVLKERKAGNELLQYYLDPNEFEEQCKIKKINFKEFIRKCAFSEAIFPFYLIPLILIIVVG